MTINKRICFFCFLCLFAGFAYPDKNVNSVTDCSNIDINYQDSPELTREERLAKMEQAFYESLDQFSLCKQQKNASENSAGNAGADSPNDQNGTTGLPEFDSIANAEISGTESIDDEQETASPGDDTDASRSEPSTNTEKINLKHIPDNIATTTPHEPAQIEEPDTYTANQRALKNGAAPEAIHEANNDDAIAKQIRLAAEIEKDPEKKKRLWDEYEKYTGSGKR